MRSMSLQLNDEVFDKLQEEAGTRQITVNVLACQFLQRYPDVDTNEMKMAIIPVPKLLVSLIEMATSMAEKQGVKDTERYQNEIIKEAAKIAFKLMKESILFMGKKCNLWVVLAVLEEYMKASGVKSDHRVEAGRRHVFVIQHDLGTNGSLFSKELLTLICESLANIRPEIQVTTNTVIASLAL